MKFTVILGQEADGGYSIFCPAIPGCASQGETIEEALAMILEAIELCLEVRAEDGIALPVETPSVIAQEIESILSDRQEEGLPLTIETREVSLEERVAA